MEEREEGERERMYVNFTCVRFFNGKESVFICIFRKPLVVLVEISKLYLLHTRP